MSWALPPVLRLHRDGGIYEKYLVLLHDDDGQEARLQAALDVTRAVGGHLTCLDVVRPPVAHGYFMAEAQAMLLEDARTLEEANLERIKFRLSGEDVPWSMLETSGEYADCVSAAAGLADLIVVNRKLDSMAGPDMLAVASRIVLESRKPVLAAPEACKRFDATGHAVVAWDGSDPAMAALTACAPLLNLAGSVTIVEVQGSSAGSVREADHPVHLRKSACRLLRHGCLRPFKNA